MPISDCFIRGAADIPALFKKMGLPEPQDGEFYKSKDSGVLVFMENEGCILRIRNNDEACGVWHPNVLQPISTRKIGNLALEIMPGVRLTKNENFANQAAKILRDSDINFYDAFARNVGLISGSQPIVIDIGGISSLSDTVHHAQKLMKQAFINKPEEPQNRYKALRAAFDQAWKTGIEKDRQEAWHKCRDARNNGLLVSAWTNIDTALPWRAAISCQKYKNRLHPSTSQWGVS